jgi:hypothetical protein
LVMSQSFPVATATIAVCMSPFPLPHPPSSTCFTYLNTNIVVLEREVFFREHQSGMYRTSAYYTSKIMSEFPMAVIGAFLQGIQKGGERGDREQEEEGGAVRVGRGTNKASGTIDYWMMGMNHDIGRFFCFVLLLCLVALITTSIAICLSAVAPDMNVANILSPSMHFLSSSSCIIFF